MSEQQQLLQSFADSLVGKTFSRRSKYGKRELSYGTVDRVTIICKDEIYNKETRKIFHNWEIIIISENNIPYDYSEVYFEINE